MDDELWMPINGFEGYSISDKGRVKNIKRGRFLTPCVNKDGVAQVTMFRGGKTYCRLVHRLVYEHFVGPCPPGYCIRHKEGFGKLDNRPETLECFVRPYPVPQSSGEANPHSKLSEDNVVSMRLERESGDSYGVLAKRYEMSRSACADVCERRTWKHIA